MLKVLKHKLVTGSLCLCPAMCVCFYCSLISALFLSLMCFLNCFQVFCVTHLINLSVCTIVCLLLIDVIMCHRSSVYHLILYLAEIPGFDSCLFSCLLIMDYPCCGFICLFFDNDWWIYLTKHQRRFYAHT